MAEKKKAYTIRDIAKRANVSYQTVSLVINKKPGVSDDTRKRIVRLMEELDYQPNRAAQMLSTHRSRTLEMIMVDVRYGGRMADSTKVMAQMAKEAGYSLLVSETDREGLEEAFDNAAARLVDGIILYAPRLKITDEELVELSNGLPLVRRDYVPGSQLAWIGFDQVYATRLAVEHLIELGHRQIAAIPPTGEIINGYWRATTWRNVLHEYGLQPGPMCEGDYSMGSGYDAAREIIASGKPFTGLVIGTDGMAIGALRALRECGLHVPDDVSMVSYDNSEHAAYTEPPLTTVAFKFSMQDRLAVKNLIEIVDDPEIELPQMVMMAELVIRESTRSLHP